MKRTLRRLAALAAVITATASLAAPAAADATRRCYGVQASATTYAVSDYQFSGEATFRFGGTEVHGTATATITGPDSTSHLFETPWGDLTTDDQLILVPIDPDNGLFSLRSRLSVVEGGSGKLHLLPQSTLDLANGVASWEARGQVCFDEN